MAEDEQPAEPAGAIGTGWEQPTLAEMQQWGWVIGRAQQMMLEHAIAAATSGADPAMPALPTLPGLPPPDVEAIAQAQSALFADSLALWGSFLDPAKPSPVQDADKDRRFAAPQWREQPLFDLLRQFYLLVTRHVTGGIDAIDGIDEGQREQLRFAARTMLDALAPSNFALTNPLVIEKMIETRGQSLLQGMEHLLADLGRGQLTHSPGNAFELGRDIATTPGKVVKETPLYQLIHYAPTTDAVLATPLVIFPPWINRFYILDLGPEKSFVRWAVEQGISVFIVSWKSADASLAETTFDDYVVRGLIDAIDTVRGLLDVPAVHAIGYCVAGTTLATTLALLAARGDADKVASATFFTAQVDFADAGELKHFIDDRQLAMVDTLSREQGYLDGRYMAAAFNLLRGRDLIWNYVVDNYLLGHEHRPFDLLHWNGDTTNLPAKWHGAYLRDFYRDNKLAKGEINVDGTAIDLDLIATPAYVQAGREDHIAPPESVWRITEHLIGPLRFVLAGSGHIAGVVNPPAKGKYQYWTNDQPADSLAAFVAGAVETQGSWWPDWLRWIVAHGGDVVPAEGARIPGGGSLPAIEDAPGSYVRAR